MASAASNLHLFNLWNNPGGQEIHWLQVGNVGHTNDGLRAIDGNREAFFPSPYVTQKYLVLTPGTRETIDDMLIKQLIEGIAQKTSMSMR